MLLYFFFFRIIFYEFVNVILRTSADESQSSSREGGVAQGQTEGKRESGDCGLEARWGTEHGS
jgi:hypothetical protein